MSIIFKIKSKIRDVYGHATHPGFRPESEVRKFLDTNVPILLISYNNFNVLLSPVWPKTLVEDIGLEGIPVFPSKLDRRSVDMWHFRNSLDPLVERLPQLNDHTIEIAIEV